MAKFNPRRIYGRWHEGFALDLHTLGSTFMGHDEFGHPRFETQRSEIGELLYRRHLLCWFRKAMLQQVAFPLLAPS